MNEKCKLEKKSIKDEDNETELKTQVNVVNEHIKKLEEALRKVLEYIIDNIPEDKMKPDDKKKQKENVNKMLSGSAEDQKKQAKALCD